MAVNPRVVIGRRSNGDIGVFVSPAGVNADTAADSALMLSITSKVSQLILLGKISGSGTVTLGLSRSPYVFLVSEFNFSSVTGHVGGPGPIRPSPGPGASPSTATINSNGASMTISTSVPCSYQVYGQAFT